MRSPIVGLRIRVTPAGPRPRRDHNASHNGIAHVAFDHKDGLRSREFIISWLTPTPHATAVYASCSASPPPHATLASRRLARPYLGPDLHRLIAPALPGAFVAVGTRVTSRPPHRSVHETFPHTAPTSGPNASSNTR